MRAGLRFAAGGSHGPGPACARCHSHPRKVHALRNIATRLPRPLSAANVYVCATSGTRAFHPASGGETNALRPPVNGCAISPNPALPLGHHQFLRPTGCPAAMGGVVPRPQVALIHRVRFRAKALFDLTPMGRSIVQARKAWRRQRHGHTVHQAGASHEDCDTNVI